MQPEFTPSEREAVTRFPQLAAEFCRFLEESGDHDRSYLLKNLCIHLAGLCAVASELPEVIPATAGTDQSPEDVDSHTREADKLSEQLRIIFGELDVYWDVYDPTERSQPGQSSLANDIAEIYLDLKDSLALQSTVELNDLCWQWRFDFRTHWSRHAAGALKIALFLTSFG